MTRAELLKIMDETREIVEQMPEDLTITSISFSPLVPPNCFRETPPVLIELRDWDRIVQEAADWGETLVEETEDNDLLFGFAIRYFDMNTHNERVCAKKIFFREGDDGQ